MKNKKDIQDAKTGTPSKTNTTNADLLKEESKNNSPIEKTELKKRKERTHNGSTKPDKNHIG